MLQKETKLTITDNSGAKLVKCFETYYKRRVTFSTEIMKASVRKTKFYGRKSKKGEKLKTLILRTKKSIMRFDGSSLQFLQNSGAILKPKTEFQIKILPRGSRITSPIPKEILKKKDDYSAIKSACAKIL
jgi:large subunit ribosomal protein L14